MYGPPGVGTYRTRVQTLQKEQGACGTIHVLDFASPPWTAENGQKWRKWMILQLSRLVIDLLRLVEPGDLKQSRHFEVSRTVSDQAWRALPRPAD